MLAIQSFGTMCGFAGAVVAVQAAVDLGVKSTSIGIFTAIIYVTGMLSGLGAGSLLARYAVPYTHLTMPTQRMVSISVEPVTLQTKKVMHYSEHE